MKDLARSLAAALKRRLGPAEFAPPPAAAEPAAVALLSTLIVKQARARTLRRVTLSLAAVAAVALLGTFALLRSPADALQVETARLALATRGEQSTALSPGNQLTAGARVETTPAGGARLRFATGSRLTLHEGSALEVLSAGADQHVRLSAGRVRADVVHLKPGERFHIVTPDTEVEVHGTRFEVEWRGSAECAGQAATVVHVEEGVVYVRYAHQSAEVKAGETWPPPCPAPAVVAPVAPAAVTAVEPSTPPTRTPPTPHQPPAPSTLAEENRRFTQVLQARQAGEVTRALELLSRWRRDFPHGHLEEDVAVEELRMLTGRDPAAAQAAARAYLTRFPRGYARPMAEELLSTP